MTVGKYKIDELLFMEYVVAIHSMQQHRSSKAYYIQAEKLRREIHDKLLAASGINRDSKEYDGFQMALVIAIEEIHQGAA